MFLRLLSRQWILTTLLVVLAMGVMARLGIWQLDRLEQRRTFNARVQAQLDQPALDLSQTLQTGAASQRELEGMEYRDIFVSGEYDFSQEVALRNQVYENQLGVHLFTPLKISGSEHTILVNRGWAPFDDFTEGNLSRYREEGQVMVRGVIRVSQERPELGRAVDPTPGADGQRLESLLAANVERIALQAPYPLLPVYIQQSTDPAWSGPPYRAELELTLTEGSHLGYALQWFSFALILGIGYPFYVRRESETGKSRDQYVRSA
ncbi:MAG: SURF1 family protein [Anaerolineales bacterium]|jgi:surfeit locus 1 family protein